MKNKKDILICSEVVDSAQSLAEFIRLNKIRQEQVRAIVIIWDEDLNDERKDGDGK